MKKAPKRAPKIIKNPLKLLPGPPWSPQEAPRWPGWPQNHENWCPELQNATQNQEIVHHIWLLFGLCLCPLLCCFLYVVVGSVWVCVRFCVGLRVCVVVVAALLGCVMPSGGAGGRGRSPLDNTYWKNHKSASGKRSRGVNTTILQEIERSTFLSHSQTFQTPFSIKIK